MMKDLKIIKFIIAILLLSTSAMAQPMTGYSYEVMIETADKSLDSNDYYNALDWFEQAYKEQRSDEIAYTIAHLHFMLRDYNRAETWFTRLAKGKKSSVEYPEAAFYQAKSLKYVGKYKEASDAFQGFISTTEIDSLKKIARLEVEGIYKMADFKPFKPVEAKPVETVNKKESDGGPVLYNRNEMYFTSTGTDSLLVVDEELDYEAKIYKSTLSETDGWSAGEPLGLHINRIGYHTASPSFSKDLQHMYFTRTVMLGNEIIESKIYISKKEGADWGPAEEVLGGVNGEFLSRHPATGELYGREVLFFSSNKAGGEGGYDLYFATVLGDGQVAEPVNLGKGINTFLDDVTPFYRDGNLYFASNGHPGFGGLDLYYTNWNGAEWSAVKNMGQGFNTSLDDFQLYLDESGENGFLVSNREGSKFLKSKTCCDDIFSIAPARIKVNLLATIGEKRGGLKGGSVKLFEMQGETPVEVAALRNMESNNFDVSLSPDKSYIIVAEHPRYDADTLKINTVGVTEPKTYEKKFVLTPKEIQPEIEIITMNEPIRMSKIYYDLNDDKILKAAEEDLNDLFALLSKYPEMKIELSAHTDAQGSDEYNMKLSQRRAESAKKYLVNKGIPESKIVAVGYGETQILNQCINDVKCSDDDHQYNRRTEFKIIEGPTQVEVKKEVIKSAEQVRQEQLQREKQERLKASQKPMIVFDNPSQNLGRVRKGEKKAMIFTFRNTGNADLIIEMASGCECSTIEWPTRPIKAGQKGEIKVLYDSKDDSGPVEKTIDVITNTNPPNSSVKYKVNVIEKK